MFSFDICFELVLKKEKNKLYKSNYFFLIFFTIIYSSKNSVFFKFPFNTPFSVTKFLDARYCLFSTPLFIILLTSVSQHVSIRR
ncbi:hypothetical protein BpHYR1_041433 [Brachionus plicatilis]|uniref:Uncharacterized protein n=1 Tax=Brachionus plicatilis TaxID=10195 RepID=A0A3M7PV23_BRAPC|nr:hypothetical protein BpHYR1_041433 [Brachionus plicatilis]